MEILICKKNGYLSEQEMMDCFSEYKQIDHITFSMSLRSRRKDIENEFPRYLFANNKEIVGELINRFLCSKNDEVVFATLRLVEYLPPNREIANHVSALQGMKPSSTMEDWLRYFDTDSVQSPCFFYYMKVVCS